MKFFLILILLSSAVFSQRIDVQTTGDCGDLDIFVHTDLNGCWDAKVEAPASVLHRTVWKSPFFYVSNAVCDGEGALRVRMDAASDYTALLRLRQNSTVHEQRFFIDQNCAQLSDEEAVLAVTTVIIFLTAGVAIYMKPRAKRKKA